MRILQVNKFHWVKGGSERYYFDLQRELTERGHEMAVFASGHPRNDPSPWSRFFAPHAEYHGTGPLEAWRLARDVIYSREAARRLELLLAEFRPDVAHLHNIHHQLSPSILGPLERRGIPVVQTLHDYKWVCPAYLFHARGQVCTRCGPGARFLPVVTRRCLHDSLPKSLVASIELTQSWRRGDAHRVRAFLAPSRFLLERVKEHGLPADRLRHVPYFLRTSDYAPATGPGQDMLYLGRLSKEKGLLTLFAALARARQVRLRVVGTGPLEAELREMAARDRLPVTFLGYLEGEALHAAVREARAVVVPSEWYENLPYAVLEAMALGVPVIGSRIGGIPEMVEEGVTGRLVPAGDVTALAHAMEGLSVNAAGAAALGQAARRRVEDTWDARPGVALVEALYAELVGGGATP